MSGEFRVGPSLVQPSLNSIVRNGKTTHLEPKMMEVLVYLAGHQGEVVTKEQLMRVVWAETFVTDDVLIRSISELRRALEDDAKEPHVIQTIPKKGYRLMPAVLMSAVEQPRKPNRRKVSAYAVVAATALIVSFAVYGLHWRGKMGRPKALGRGREITQKQLTSNPPERSLTWAAISPDGKYLAYTDPDGLYLRLLDTGETHSVSLPVRFGVNSTFTWFPDGTRLLVAGNIANQVDIAWIVSVFGGAPRKLRNGVSWASVSPDGKRIAFIDVNQDGHPRELWVMEASGEEPHRIVAFDEGNFLQQVWWSPDGRRIAYMRKHQDSNGRPRQTIEACDLEGTHFTEIVENTSDTVDFYWLPDGRIIFALENQTGDSALWEVAVDPSTGMRMSEPKRIIHWPRAAFMGLSATGDGKKLLVLEGTAQNDIYLGEFDSKKVRLRTTRQFTSDERDDIPAAWTRDGKVLLFTSDRSGSYDIYKQAVQGSGPQAIIVGPNDEYEPRFSPDGSWVLYWSGSFPDTKRLMRIPPSGGGSELVLTSSTNAAFRCPSYRGASCILSERNGMQLLFFRLDAVKGKGVPVAKTERPGLQMNSIGVPMWDLSPDGSRIALEDGCCRTRILDLNSGLWRAGPTIEGNFYGLNIAWSADGHGIFVTRVLTTSQILYADLQGHTHVVSEGANQDFSSLVPSPDGRYLAFSTRSINSRNAWLLENF
jgi:Tol biopolymer transport system component/DNA-binding winged helix-turn-helix (wHTH) protein